MDQFIRQKQVIGLDAHKRLLNAKVTIVGLGGLGSVVAHLLARMGVGTLILQDFDFVADHNLNRQHLYTQKDIGLSKAKTCAQHIKEISPQTTCVIEEKHITQAQDIIPSDIIVDCTDNHSARMYIDDFCFKKKIPWIHGAAIRELGTVFFFDPNKKIRYQSIYKNRTKEEMCANEGVLVTITTLVGTLQAEMVLDYLCKRPICEEFIRIRSNECSIEKIPVFVEDKKTT
jgi:molybdopterin-synthase adenylyltransferase